MVKNMAYPIACIPSFAFFIDNKPVYLTVGNKHAQQIPMEDKLNGIFQRLSSKSCLKQSVYRNTGTVFNQMEAEATAISNALSAKVKFSGDLLSFIRHSNTVTLPSDHPVMQTDYIRNNPANGYFGHIMIYNFMADTVKYHRLNDPGYLLARMLVNHENHFLIEGVRQLDFRSEDIEHNVLTESVLREFIESAMLTAIDNDLVSPGYQDIQVISYSFKLANQMVSQGEKIGFQMSGLVNTH
jgi:hypothetical protein